MGRPEYIIDFIAGPSKLRRHYGLSMAEWRVWLRFPDFPKPEPGLNKYETDDIDAWRRKRKGKTASFQAQDAISVQDDGAKAWATRFVEGLK